MRRSSSSLWRQLRVQWTGGGEVEGSGAALEERSAPSELEAARDEPPVTRTAEEEDALARASTLADELEVRSGDVATRVWRGATEAELHRALELADAATPASLARTWRHDTASVLDVRPEQDAALASLDAVSSGAFEVEWYDAMRSPGRLDRIGYVRRGRSPVDTWLAFERDAGAALRDLFGLGSRDTLVLVEEDEQPEMTILRFERRIDDIPAAGQWLFAYVTRAESRVGPGLLWRITARLDRDAAATLSPTRPDGFRSEAHARSAAGAPVDASVELRYICIAGCRAVYHVHLDDSFVTVDAVTGENLGETDARLYDWAGTAYMQVYPLGATAPTTAPVRFRGGNVRDASGSNNLGWFSFADGGYDVSGSQPFTIDVVGGRTNTGAWPLGRVDRRTVGNWNAIVELDNWWWPSSWPNPQFTYFPDSGFTRGQAVIYAWLAYWQQLYGDHVRVQTADTVSFLLNPDGSGQGITGASNVGNMNAPGAPGQSTWGRIQIGWRTGDNLQGSTDEDHSLMAHEFAHTIGTCAATAGIECTNLNPGSQSHPEIPLSQWRRHVWAASVENLASAQAAVVSQFRSGDNGGATPGGYQPGFNYLGYTSRTDSFGSATQDAAGIPNCGPGGTACPSSHLCVAPTDESPDGPNLGICARRCPMGNECDPGLWCNQTACTMGSQCASGTCNTTANRCTCTVNSQCPSRQFCDPATSLCTEACWPSAYWNDWFKHVVARLSFENGWKSALNVINVASAGNSNNWSRDFAVGSDTWLGHMADASVFSRFEVTKSVRSVNQEGGTPQRDDFTSNFFQALPIAVRTTTGTRVWWGSGTGSWPSFEDVWDHDYVLLRAFSGQTYEIAAQPKSGSNADLGITVYRWNGSQTQVVSGSAPSGPSAAVVTPALQNDWYLVAFWPRTFGTGTWEATIKLTSASDDFYGSGPAEGYPMASGDPIGGFLTASDTDRFQIYVPTATSLVITATGTPTPQIAVYDPGNNWYTSGTGSVSIPSTPSTGHWFWSVFDTSGVPRSYTTTATLGCAGICDHLTGAPPIGARWSWGDRFAGRLLNGSAWAEYSVSLAGNERLAVAVGDVVGGACRVAVDLYGPSTMDYFNGQPVFQWTDGADAGGSAASQIGADPDGRGAGGHFIAPVAGTYRVRVRSSAFFFSPCIYRLFLARPGQYYQAMPAW